MKGCSGKLIGLLHVKIKIGLTYLDLTHFKFEIYTHDLIKDCHRNDMLPLCDSKQSI
jgi:hypothetical protein